MMYLKWDLNSNSVLATIVYTAPPIPNTWIKQSGLLNNIYRISTVVFVIAIINSSISYCCSYQVIIISFIINNIVIAGAACSRHDSRWTNIFFHNGA